MDALRWSSIPYCLAALALAAPSAERTHAADAGPPLELATSPEVIFDTVSEVNNDDRPPPEPRPHSTWTGPCADQSDSWKVPIEITLEVTPPDGSDQLFIDGKLAFAGRRVHLSTYESGDYYNPHARARWTFGTMTEIGGIHTEWEVYVGIERIDARHLVGSVEESFNDRFESVICRFDWHR